MGSSPVFFTLLALVLTDGAISDDVYTYVPTTVGFPEEASQLMPQEALANPSFAWYRFPYSVPQLTASAPMVVTSDNDDTRKIEITKVVEKPTRVNTATAIILNAPPGTNVSLGSLPLTASNPNAGNSAAAISPNDESKVVTVNTNGIPRVLYSDAKTVFSILNPPHYALKQPPNAPSPALFSATGSSTKPGVPHVGYAPVNTIFHIPSPPQFDLKPPSHGPLPGFLSATGHSTKPSVPHILYAPVNTAYHILNSPHYAFIPPPLGPPAIVLNASGNSTKDSVPHVVYAPVNTVFNIPNPPQYGLKLPSRGPPLGVLNATDSPTIHAANISSTKHVLISSGHSVFHINSPFTTGAKEAIFQPSAESIRKTIRQSADNEHNALSITVSASPAVAEISSPLVRHGPMTVAPEMKLLNKTEIGARPATVVIMPATTVVRVAYPLPYMFTTPRPSPQSPPNWSSKTTTPSPPVVTSPIPSVVRKYPTVNPISKVIPFQTTTAHPAKQEKKKTTMLNKQPVPTVADTRPSIVPQVPAHTTKPVAITSNKTFTHSVITKTTVNLTRNVTSHHPGPYTPSPKTTQSPHASLSRRTTRVPVTAKTKRSYQPIGKKIIKNAPRSTTKRYQPAGKKVIHYAHRAKTEHTQTIEQKVVHHAPITTTKRYQLFGKNFTDEAHRGASKHSNTVNASLSAGEQEKVVQSVIRNQTSRVNLKLPKDTTASPTNGFTPPETIAEVVSAGRQELSSKASLTKGTAHRPTYRPPPSYPSRFPSTVKTSKEHSVVSTISTGKVAEMKHPSIIKKVTGLASSVVDKALKAAGSITAKPESPLVGKTGTQIIAQPVVVLKNVTMQPPPPVTYF